MLSNVKEILLKKYEDMEISVLTDLDEGHSEFIVRMNSGRRVRFEDLDEAMEYVDSARHSWKNYTQIAHRMEIIKQMHEYVLGQIGDEEAYMSWIYLVPDEPTEEDFESLAEEDWIECVNDFRSLVVCYDK